MSRQANKVSLGVLSLLNNGFDTSRAIWHQPVAEQSCLTALRTLWSLNPCFEVVRNASKRMKRGTISGALAQPDGRHVYRKTKHTVCTVHCIRTEINGDNVWNANYLKFDYWLDAFVHLILFGVTRRIYINFIKYHLGITSKRLFSRHSHYKRAPIKMCPFDMYKAYAHLYLCKVHSYKQS